MSEERKTTTEGESAASASSARERASTTEKPSTPANWKARFRWIGIGLIVVVVALVIVQNRAETAVKIPLVGAITMPLWLLLTLHFAAGGLAGIVFSAWRRKKKRSPLTGH